MKRTIVIHQPDFLPYLGFFDRFLHSDLWVILDNVQFVNRGNSWHYRDRIKTHQGAQWLSISVKKCPKEILINEVELSETIPWKVNNLNLLKQNYSKAPFFKEVFPFIEELYDFRGKKMVDFNLKSIHLLMELFDIKIETIFASQLNAEGSKNELLIDILKKVNADTYLAGTGAKSYMEVDLFNAAGIEVMYQDFSHPVYPQLHGEFIPYLSSIDLLLNCGVEASRKIIRNQ